MLAFIIAFRTRQFCKQNHKKTGLLARMFGGMARNPTAKQGKSCLILVSQKLMVTGYLRLR